MPSDQGFYSPVNRLPSICPLGKNCPRRNFCFVWFQPKCTLPPHPALLPGWPPSVGMCGNRACSPLSLAGKAREAWKFYVSPGMIWLSLSPLRTRALLEGMIGASQKGLDDTGLGVILRPCTAGRGGLPVSSGSDAISLEPATSGQPRACQAQEGGSHTSLHSSPDVLPLPGCRGRALCSAPSSLLQKVWKFDARFYRN